MTFLSLYHLFAFLYLHHFPHNQLFPAHTKKDKYPQEVLNMKATGIVRRIDDLGRVVVPKEIRRTLRIREGDPMEIFTDREGEIILKKYSPIRELNLLAQQYADALYQSTGYPVCICDTDQFIAVSGIPKRSMIGQKVHEDLSSAMEKRQYLFARSGEKDYVTLTAGSGAVYTDKKPGSGKNCFLPGTRLFQLLSLKIHDDL